MPPSQLSIVAPGAGVAGNGRLVDISPDGERIVFIDARDDATIASYIQELDRSDAVPLSSLQGGVDLNFSPDGRSVYFGDVGRLQLMRASIDGGAPVPVRGVPSSPFIADAPDGSMWVSTPSFEVFHVAADGTVREAVRERAAEAHRRDHAGVPRRPHRAGQGLSDARTASCT